ncbi:hypothetical protein R4Z10_12190 [Niallia sp. XMNu-256]|uniref:hypothetical protein n=1 Tax=Niallia sp. XMNu-256 TaxID=3082444 RepID=UPI0030D241D5
MVEKQMNAKVNDLLDLYLLAGKLGDHDWQKEIIQKLGEPKQETEEDYLQKIRNLWAEYKDLNTQILKLYDRLKSSTTDEDLFGKINALKEERLRLTHKIYKTERKVKELYE